jgi:hypothetical protein
MGRVIAAAAYSNGMKVADIGVDESPLHPDLRQPVRKHMEILTAWCRRRPSTWTILRRWAACCTDGRDGVGGQSDTLLRISPSCRTKPMLLAATIFRGRSGA